MTYRQTRHFAELVTTYGKIIPIENNIYWHIENFTPDMDKFRVIFTIEKMFKLLQPYVVPTFQSESDINQAQIVIRFKNNGDPGLPEPFEDSVLAYAYLANNTTAQGLISDIFFNDAYQWAEMHSSTQVGLLKVAVHEALHSLGLGHSDVPHSILYWQYNPNTGIQFTQDVIDELANLYGVVDSDVDVAHYYAQLFKSKTRLMKLTEPQLLTMTDHLGIEAHIDDYKTDTAQAIYEHLHG